MLKLHITSSHHENKYFFKNLFASKGKELGEDQKNIYQSDTLNGDNWSNLNTYVPASLEFG